MADAAIDPSTLPVQKPAPGAAVRRFSELLPTTLSPERVWDELTRAMAGTPGAVLWPTEVSAIRALQTPIAQGTTLAVLGQYKGATPMHYRLVRFEPPRLLQYACVEGHNLAGGAVVSVESAGGNTVLRWEGEYHGVEAGLVGLDRYTAAFFPRLAQRLKQLESAA